MYPRARWVFVLVQLVVFVALGIGSFEYRPLARYFPLTMSGVGAAVSVLALLVWWRTSTMEAVAAQAPPASGAQDATARAFTDSALNRNELYRLGYFASWLAGLIAVIYVAGALPGTALFLTAYLRRAVEASWWRVVWLVLATVTTLHFGGSLMDLEWPLAFWQ